jgi:DNA-directed RNA polymerase subunit RPC12/RpoP
MKFLCVACDEPMRLTDTAGPDEGSLRVGFACPACNHRIAMLTNPWETQLVRTLGVKVGAGAADPPPPFAAIRAGLAHQREATVVEEPGIAGREASEAAIRDAPSADGPGCPFAAMIGESTPAPAGLPWTAEAEGRLDRIPAFIRPMARKAIERFAGERGYGTITGEVMDEARDFMGM